MALGGALAASPPDPELHRYHRALGLAPAAAYYPERTTRQELASLALADAGLLSRLRAGGFESGFAPFVSEPVSDLFRKLDLVPSWCGSSPHTYERANDKLAFALAASRFGFPALPGRAVRSEIELSQAWRDLAPLFDGNCALRLRRGAGGRGIVPVSNLDMARDAWRRLRRSGDVALFPWIPAKQIRRQISTHGLVRDGRFSPLCYTDQIVCGTRYRGGRQAGDWEPHLLREVGRAHDGAARWLAELGFGDAAAGFDGVLIEHDGSTRFLLLDPNIRATGTTLPWTAVARLSEMAGRRFLWQVESFRLVGRRPDLGFLQRRLGGDFLSPERPESGGILPSIVHAGLRAGPFAAWWLRAIFLAHDAHHLDHLRARVGELGRVV